MALRQPSPRRTVVGMAKWKYAVTALSSATIGALAAVAAVYIAADPLLGKTIDQRVTSIVSEEVDAAVVRERDETVTPALSEILKQVDARFDRLEARELTLEMGLPCDVLDSPYALNRRGETQPICLIEGP